MSIEVEPIKFQTEAEAESGVVDGPHLVAALFSN